jgi:hypothetical protein
MEGAEERMTEGSRLGSEMFRMPSNEADETGQDRRITTEKPTVGFTDRLPAPLSQSYGPFLIPMILMIYMDAL